MHTFEGGWARQKRLCHREACLEFEWSPRIEGLLRSIKWRTHVNLIREIGSLKDEYSFLVESAKFIGQIQMTPHKLLCPNYLTWWVLDIACTRGSKNLWSNLVETQRSTKKQIRDSQTQISNFVETQRSIVRDLSSTHGHSGSWIWITLYTLPHLAKFMPPTAEPQRADRSIQPKSGAHRKPRANGLSSGVHRTNFEFESLKISLIYPLFVLFSIKPSCFGSEVKGKLSFSPPPPSSWDIALVWAERRRSEELGFLCCGNNEGGHQHSHRTGWDSGR